MNGAKKLTQLQQALALATTAARRKSTAPDPDVMALVSECHMALVEHALAQRQHKAIAESVRLLGELIDLYDHDTWQQSVSISEDAARCAALAEDDPKLVPSERTAALATIKSWRLRRCAAACDSGRPRRSRCPRSMQSSCRRMRKGCCGAGPIPFIKTYSRQAFPWSFLKKSSSLWRRAMSI
jgi:hypothetical protein